MAGGVEDGVVNTEVHQIGDTPSATTRKGSPARAGLIGATVGLVGPRRWSPDRLLEDDASRHGLSARRGEAVAMTGVENLLTVCYATAADGVQLGRMNSAELRTAEHELTPATTD